MRSLVGYRAGARCALIIPQRDYLGPTMLLGPFLSGRERPGLRLSRGGERPGLTHEPLGLGGLGDQRLKPSYHRPLVGHNSVAKSSHVAVERLGVSVMKSSVIKRSVAIHGHKTSISLEDDFWISLREIADSRGQTLPQLVANIDAERKSANLSSAIRLFVLRYFQDQSASRDLVDLAHEDARPVALE